MNLPNYKEARNRLKNYRTVKYDIEKSIINKYSGKTYFLKTYGCQMNEHDSENIAALLEKIGFTRVDDYNDADLVLLNTCSIRENAHNKAFGMLGRLKHLKMDKKDLIVGLCGCMAQEASVVEEILKDYKFVNFVFGSMLCSITYPLPFISQFIFASVQYVFTSFLDQLIKFGNIISLLFVNKYIFSVTE